MLSEPRPLRNFLQHWTTVRYENIWEFSLFWPVSTYSRRVVDCVFVYLRYLQRVWLSWRWKGCVVAAWSSSTGNASKRWELTETRCLRLRPGDSYRGTRASAGEVCFPLTVLLSCCLLCLSVSLNLLSLCCFLLSLCQNYYWSISRMRSKQLKDSAVGDELNSHSIFSFLTSCIIKRGHTFHSCVETKCWKRFKDYRNYDVHL